VSDHGEWEYLKPPIVLMRGDLREFALPWDVILRTKMYFEDPRVEVVAIKRCLP
jgi:hypothetical protein